MLRATKSSTLQQHGMTFDVLEKWSLQSVLCGCVRHTGIWGIRSSCSLWSRCHLSAWSRVRTWTPPPGPRGDAAAACAPASSAAPPPPCTQIWARKEGRKRCNYCHLATWKSWTGNTFHTNLFPAVKSSSCSNEHCVKSWNYASHPANIFSFYLSSGQAWFPEKPSSEKLFITVSSVNRSGSNLHKQRHDHRNQTDNEEC